MSTETKSVSRRTYIIGFLLSLVLTLESYLLIRQYQASRHSNLSHSTLTCIILALATVQVFVQLIFFLHLDRESKPRWNKTVLLFAAMVVVIVVFGSLWIMSSLNYHHEQMSPSQTDQYIIEDEGINYQHD